MTGAAEFLREVVGAHVARIEDALVLKLSRLHRFDVLCAGPVAGFTTDTGHHPFKLQLFAADRSRRVAGGAASHPVGADSPAPRFLPRPRRGGRITHSEIQPLDLFKKADAALVE